MRPSSMRCASLMRPSRGLPVVAGAGAAAGGQSIIAFPSAMCIPLYSLLLQVMIFVAAQPCSNALRVACNMSRAQQNMSRCMAAKGYIMVCMPGKKVGKSLKGTKQRQVWEENWYHPTSSGGERCSQAARRLPTAAPHSGGTALQHAWVDMLARAHATRASSAQPAARPAGAAWTSRAAA